jgi:hypothetical protein
VNETIYGLDSKQQNHELIISNPWTMDKKRKICIELGDDTGFEG